jgi:uncharacterized protein YjbI with pentapeptide repeats
MHSASANKDSHAFWQAIEQQLSDGRYGFRGYVFPDPPDPKLRYLFCNRTFATTANFDRALFLGQAHFTASTFSGEASFRETTFAKDVSFFRTTFAGWADFTKARFVGKQSDSSAASLTTAQFDGAKFSGSADFDETVFGCAEFDDAAFAAFANFSGTAFHGKASFRGAKFEGGVAFRESMNTSGERKTEPTKAESRTGFLQPADFSWTTFTKGGTFDKVSFEGHVDFHGAKFLEHAIFSKGPVFSKGANFSGVTFGGMAQFEEVKFLDDTVFGFTALENVLFRHMDLSHCRFRYSEKIDKAEFDHVTWASWCEKPLWGLLKAQTRMANADEVHARTKLTSPEEQIRNLKDAERVYRGLRASYEARKDPPMVGQLYFAEMEMRRLASSPHWLGRRVGSLAAWYGLVSGYGERWGQPLWWFVGVCLLWAVLYVNTGLWLKVTEPGTGQVSQTRLEQVKIGLAPLLETRLEALGAFGHALIHSFLVATLIGRDTYALPANAPGHVLQTIEIIVGPLLLGLMALAIRRRFQR